MRRAAIALVVLLVLGVGALGWFVLMPSVDLDNALHFESEMIRLGYPGDWVIDENAPGYDPARNLVIAGDGACITIRLFESDVAAADLATALARETHPDAMSASETLDRMGRYEGSGLEMKVSGGLGGRIVRLFVSEVSPGYRLEIGEELPALTAGRLDPGVQLVRNTLRVFPPDDPTGVNAPAPR